MKAVSNQTGSGGIQNPTSAQGKCWCDFSVVVRYASSGGRFAPHGIFLRIGFYQSETGFKLHPVPFWRKRWDSNPRALADYRISSVVGYWFIVVNIAHYRLFGIRRKRRHYCH